ncbi:nucleotidyltransferase substrate binding protein [Virgibacillus sp. FSP13]
MNCLTKSALINNIKRDGVIIYENKERLYEKLDDFKRAISRLNEATMLEIESDIIYDGVIQRFEFTFELNWKLMEMFLEYTGTTEIRNPRTTIREAFANGLIDDGEKWIDMMVDRNRTSYLYDEDEASLVYEKIKNCYNILLLKLRDRMEKKIKQIR